MVKTRIILPILLALTAFFFVVTLLAKNRVHTASATVGRTEWAPTPFACI